MSSHSWVAILSPDTAGSVRLLITRAPDIEQAAVEFAACAALLSRLRDTAVDPDVADDASALLVRMGIGARTVTKR